MIVAKDHKKELYTTPKPGELWALISIYRHLALYLVTDVKKTNERRATISYFFVGHKMQGSGKGEYDDQKRWDFNPKIFYRIA